MTRSGRPVACAAKVYHALLRAYPAAFNQDFGEEMMLVFHDLALDAWNRSGWIGLTAVWFRVLVDLARTVPREHYLEYQRTPRSNTISPVKTTALACVSIFSSFVLNMVWFVVLDAGVTLVAWTHQGFHYRNWPPSHMLLTLLPQLFTGLTAGCMKWFYRPYLIAPLGPMIFAGALSFSNPHAPWLLPWLPAMGYVVAVAAATLIGCCASAKAWRRQAPACTA